MNCQLRFMKWNFLFYFFNRKQKSNFLPQNEFQKRLIFFQKQMKLFSKQESVMFLNPILSLDLFSWKKNVDFPWKFFLNFFSSHKNSRFLAPDYHMTWLLKIEPLRVKVRRKSFYVEMISQFLSLLKIREENIKRNKGEEDKI